MSLEAKKARDSTYGRDVLKTSIDTDGTIKAKKQTNQPTKSRCLATKIKTEKKRVSKEEAEEASTFYLKCEGKYSIDVCDEFLKAPLENKQAFAKSKGICFGCLERAGHLNENWTVRTKNNAGHATKDILQRSTNSIPRRDRSDQGRALRSKLTKKTKKLCQRK